MIAVFGGSQDFVTRIAVTFDRHGRSNDGNDVPYFETTKQRSCRACDPPFDSGELDTCESGWKGVT
ncbi:MAG: hypothetical protein D6741_02500 [Planctomycetota bacterium]|nr:MAG: hypothetical protein D6741_02500 [Planctomycetota bacterium]